MPKLKGSTSSERDRLRADLRVVSDFLEELLDAGKFPPKGRSCDDKDAMIGWWDDRWAAIKSAQTTLADCTAADEEASRLHKQSLAHEAATRKEHIAIGIEEAKRALQYNAWKAKSIPEY